MLRNRRRLNRLRSRQRHCLSHLRSRRRRLNRLRSRQHHCLSHLESYHRC